MFEAKMVHCGQYKRYGDFYREWEIRTDRSEEETVEWCFENLYKRRVPRYSEWRKNIQYGGARWHDAGYYFAGHYSIHPIDGGFKFTICEPYAD